MNFTKRRESHLDISRRLIANGMTGTRKDFATAVSADKYAMCGTWS